MAAGTFHSGKNGTVKRDVTGAPTVVPHCVGWTLTCEQTETRMATNSTGGYKEGALGVTDATGTIRIAIHDGEVAPFTAGTEYDLELHIDGTGSNYYKFDALTNGPRNMTVNLEDRSEVMIAEYTFGSQGVVTANGDVPPVPT